MRILFTGEEPFIPDCYSAPNRTILELSQQLALMGHEPVVLSGMSSVKGKQIFRDSNFDFPIYRSSYPAESFAALLTTILPDIVVLTGRELARLVRILSKMDFPVATWLFDNEHHGLDDLVLNAEIQFLATSSLVSYHVRAFFGVTAEVVPPFIREPGEVRSSPGDRVLFFNPTRKKGIKLALDIARERPGMRFTFVETGCLPDDWRQYCYKQAAKCGNIDWHKPVLSMYELYSQTRLMLVPSICEEGFCRAVTEAQRFGIPVLASDRGYLPTNVGEVGSTLSPDEPLHVWLEELDRIWESAGNDPELVSLTREHALRSELNYEKVAGQFVSIMDAHIEKNFQKIALHQK